MKPNYSALAVWVLLFPLGACLAVCPKPKAVHTKWDLWKQGTCLRGANIWQTSNEQIPASTVSLWPGYVGPPYPLEDFKKLAALGANYVNLSVPGLFFELPPYRVNKKIEEALDALVKQARDADLFTVISFRTGPGRNEKGFKNNEPSYHKVWQDQAAQDAWIEMWKYGAARYAKESNVVGYDLMVEPNGNAVFFDIWESNIFYPAYENTTYDWNRLAKKIALGIREVDPSAPLLIAAPSFDSVDWLKSAVPPKTDNVVYLVHQYDPFVYTHQTSTEHFSYPGDFDEKRTGKKVRIDKKWLTSHLSPIDSFKQATHIPVSTNEFGVKRWGPGASDFIQDEIAIFESFGMNHAVWLWESSFPPIDWDEFNFRHGADPKKHGDVSASAYGTVLKKNWSKNRVRPSNVVFQTRKIASKTKH